MENEGKIGNNVGKYLETNKYLQTLNFISARTRKTGSVYHIEQRQMRKDLKNQKLTKW